MPSTELRAGLEDLGGRVDSISVFEWALPEDTGPIEENLKRIAGGAVDMALFTSSRQVIHMLQVSHDLGIEAAVRAALGRMLIGSVGPVTSETLRECNLRVDFEPEHPKLGHLITEAARYAATERLSARLGSQLSRREACC